VELIDYSLRWDFSSDERLLVMAVVDVSGSTKGKALSDQKKSIKRFAVNLGKFYKTAMSAFNKTPRMVIPFTRDKKEFIAGIDCITAAGNTALYNALHLAFEKVESELAPRKAAVFFSELW
jgi:Mg-chelatase subunit ChlD